MNPLLLVGLAAAAAAMASSKKKADVNGQYRGAAYQLIYDPPWERDPPLKGSGKWEWNAIGIEIGLASSQPSALAAAKAAIDARLGGERRYSGPTQMKAKLAKLPPILNPVKPAVAKIPPPKQSYKFKIAAKGPGLALMCRNRGMRTIEDVARCVASDLFPLVGWPVTKESEAWERNAWHQIINVSRAEFGLKALPKQMKTQAFKIG